MRRIVDVLSGVVLGMSAFYLYDCMLRGSITLVALSLYTLAILLAVFSLVVKL